MQKKPLIAFAASSAALGLLISRTLTAAEAAPLIDETEAYAHSFPPAPVVYTPWADISKHDTDMQWRFDLEVDAKGRVTSATLKSGNSQFREDATRAALAARFRPFERNGRAVPVQLEYPVGSKTSDYIGPVSRSFPTSIGTIPVTIVLRRTACFGSCPNYRIELTRTGEAMYEGFSNVLVVGKHQWRVDPHELVALLARFRRANYFSLKGYYEQPVTDLPTYITVLSIGKQRKFVLDYGNSGFGGAMASTTLGGEDPQMPAAVTEIEDAIDKVAKTSSWTTGDSNTTANLRAAKWNFRSPAAGRALGQLLRQCNGQLAREFLLEGTPVDIDEADYSGSSAAASAHCGDVALVRALAARGALRDKKQSKAFLEASVESGYPDLVEFALGHYRIVNIQDTEGVPLISKAAAAYESEDPPRGHFDSAQVVHILIRAGADPNARDSERNTPLFAANSEEVADALISSGADPNARNALGQTPLFAGHFEDPMKAILKAGTDIEARDKQGQTAIFHQREVASMRLLIRAGANVNAVDDAGYTPIEVVGWEYLAEVLLEGGAKWPTDPSHREQLIARAAANRWTVLLPLLKAAK